MKNQIYMAVTADEFELPVAVFDSCKEMADFLGITRETLYPSISKKAVIKKHRVYRIPAGAH